ncbi:DgyrCDS7353 [Dimorphilus gyrociliatus]|uniref:DgyrCDS7353 n=1 Tax=Dimorphilus gyrociliatus TaxID=2664684 RepID=A0A7I8VQS5_9ANNE|nr:DgyrCDS7353 [Dimorphilus gyrociliatus]
MSNVFNSLWKQFKTLFIVHVLMGYIFVVSGLIVCGLMLLCYLTIWPWNKCLYRKIVVRLAYLHWSQFTFLAQWWSGSNATVHLENVDDLQYIGQEHNITMMNHKYDIDWLMAWVLSERLQMLGGTKIYGKSSLKLVPLIGWAWTFTESIFLKREWDKDKEIIKRDLSFLREYPDNYWVTLLLFCEGTRFTEEKLIKSNEIARKKGLKELKHHLLPRTKGFVLSMHGVKEKFSSILDLTIGFRSDGAQPTLMNVICGRPVKAELYVRRIPLSQIPTDNDENCSDWVHKLFQEKDEIYDSFVKEGEYKIGTKREIPKRPHDLITYLCWAVLLLTPLFYYIGAIFINGSLLIKIIFLLIISLATIGVRLMIMVTEIKQGSKYGTRETVNNNSKKID